MTIKSVVSKTVRKVKKAVKTMIEEEQLTFEDRVNNYKKEVEAAGVKHGVEIVPVITIVDRKQTPSTLPPTDSLNAQEAQASN